jgi:hypothetical protein
MDIKIGSYTIKMEIVLLIVILLIIIFVHTMCSCSTMSLQEGFDMARKATQKVEGLTTKPKPKPHPESTGKVEGFANQRTMFETPFSETSSPDYYMNPNDWAQQTLVYSKGTTPSVGVQEFWDRTKEQKPTVPGQINFFDNISFKPECCPSDTSTGEGCACYTVEDYNILKTRGGNTTLESEY